MNVPFDTFEQLQSQINHACSHQPNILDEWQQSYLAHVLMRYSTLTDSVPRHEIPVPALKAIDQNSLLRVGDECLLLCGLCPRLVNYINTKSNPTAILGSAAYAELALRSDDFAHDLYTQLSQHYTDLITVLQTMAACAERGQPSLLEQAEQWHDGKNITQWQTTQQYLGSNASLGFDTTGLNNRH